MSCSTRLCWAECYTNHLLFNYNYLHSLFSKFLRPPVGCHVDVKPAIPFTGCSVLPNIGMPSYTNTAAKRECPRNSNRYSRLWRGTNCCQPRAIATANTTPAVGRYHGGEDVGHRCFLSSHGIRRNFMMGKSSLLGLWTHCLSHRRPPPGSRTPDPKYSDRLRGMLPARFRTAFR